MTVCNSTLVHLKLFCFSHKVWNPLLAFADKYGSCQGHAPLACSPKCCSNELERVYKSNFMHDSFTSNTSTDNKIRINLQSNKNYWNYSNLVDSVLLAGIRHDHAMVFGPLQNKKNNYFSFRLRHTRKTREHSTRRGSKNLSLRIHLFFLLKLLPCLPTTHVGS